mgnify:CR=1 FL=1
MNVLSLFDGMSGAMAALQSIGIKPDNYFACEIDKYSEAVSKYHYPEIIRLGDVTKVNFFGLPKIDLLVAGFPCQAFSSSGKRLNFDDPRGMLFFEVVRLLEELQPTYFLLENVASMKKAIRHYIDELIGYKSIEINSALVSAQNRNRLYWTNILEVTQPKDKSILLREVLDDGANSVLRWQNKITGSVVDNKKAATLRSSGGTDIRKMQRVICNVNPSGNGMNGNVFDVDGKSPPLTTNKGEGIKITGAAMRGRYLDENGKRLDSTVKSQSGLAKQRIELRGDGKSNCLSTVQKDSLLAIKQRARGFNKGGLYSEKSPTLSANSWQDNNHLTDGFYWRKLTPIECERLQTFPDDFTKFGIDLSGKQFQVSNSQRYKMLGNGFTRDVIAHILSFMDFRKLKIVASFCTA